MYRGLLGFYNVESKAVSVEYSDDGFDYNQHQVMVGVYLDSSSMEVLNYGGYSFNRRLGAMAMNLVPGLGSMTLMKDYLGGTFSIGLIVGGFVMMVYGEEEVPSGVHSSTLLGTTGKTTTLGYIGLCSFIGGELFNLVRPWIRSNPDSRLSFGNPDGFKFAVLPKEGDLQYVGAYKKSF